MCAHTRISTRKGLVELRYDVSEFLDTDGLFVDTAGATKVSVGVFVINVEHSRRRQKIATSENKVSCLSLAKTLKFH